MLSTAAGVAFYVLVYTYLVLVRVPRTGVYRRVRIPGMRVRAPGFMFPSKGADTVSINQHTPAAARRGQPLTANGRGKSQDGRRDTGGWRA